jgi:hypothetical protein
VCILWQVAVNFEYVYDFGCPTRLSFTVHRKGVLGAQRRVIEEQIPAMHAPAAPLEDEEAYPPDPGPNSIDAHLPALAKHFINGGSLFLGRHKYNDFGEALNSGGRVASASLVPGAYIDEFMLAWNDDLAGCLAPFSWEEDDEEEEEQEVEDMGRQFPFVRSYPNLAKFICNRRVYQNARISEVSRDKAKRAVSEGRGWRSDRCNKRAGGAGCR